MRLIVSSPDHGTHYVVLAYELSLKVQPSITLDAQHSGLRWLCVSEIVLGSDVHPNTKAYFR
jgi:colanic acid biosynthesis protein WcaH